MVFSCAVLGIIPPPQALSDLRLPWLPMLTWLLLSATVLSTDPGSALWVTFSSFIASV